MEAFQQFTTKLFLWIDYYWYKLQQTWGDFSFFLDLVSLSIRDGRHKDVFALEQLGLAEGLYIRSYRSASRELNGG